jgi:hypothetical protein
MVQSDAQRGGCLQCWGICTVVIAVCIDFYLFSDTECAPGRFFGDAGCEDCSAGYFKAGIGPEACQPCPAGTFSATKGTAWCEPCKYGTVSWMASRSCEMCNAGSFAFNSRECRPCPAHAVSAQGSASCTICPEGSMPDSTNSTCLCFAGWSVEKNKRAQFKCTRCPQNTYKADIGNDACVPCSEGWQSYEGSTLCLPAITDSLLMLASEVQRGLQWLNKATVAEVADLIAQWISSVNMTDITESVSEAAAKAAQHILEWICRDLFGGTARNCFGSTSDQSESSEGTFSSGPTTPCGPEEVIRLMQGMEVYRSFETKSRLIVGSHRALKEDCRAMKKAAQQLFLLMHPDKFNAKHRECPHDASTQAIMIVSRMYVEAKVKCRRQ